MADLHKIKSILYNKCVQYVSDRIETAQNLLNVSQDAAKLEVKSSVGDKHETGRAMMHLETVKASLQLAEALKLEKAMSNFDDKSVSTRVQLGSLV
ncbi:MAG: 3-oxoacyl-ACP synthase, partial [Bacteroidia bacterium]|nr:3-oxoacyl-ACP synthase [Bacteroidia bacterium]